MLEGTELADRQLHDAYDAISKGDMEKLKRAVNRWNVYKSLNRRDQKLLMHAADEKQPEAVAFLLKLKANPNATCSSGLTCLWYAMRRQDERCIRLMLDAGADPCAGYKDSDGTFRSYVNDAYLYGPAIDAMMKEAAKNIAIVHAAGNKDFDKVKECLEQGVPVDTIGPFAQTALFHAVVKDHLPMIEFLLSHKADPTRIDDLDMHVLMHAQSTAALDLLVAAGARISGTRYTEEGCRLKDKSYLFLKTGVYEHLQALLDKEIADDVRKGMAVAAPMGNRKLHLKI